ncbi:MAG TPA: biotin--[acetyl-CoA-carboxylase] ligase [Candidatus Binatia bacterium]|nr:biotin--[acetyl-CoA-carboxylase] ligase [Candidatus Binatia bacterium]
MDQNGGASQFDDEAIVRALAGTRFDRVDFRATTGSTNDDALELLGDPSSAGLTICADFQTDGAGRKAGRRWIAPPGSSLLVTTILAGTIPATQLWAVPFWAGICAYEAIEDAAGVAPRLRWPNDVLLGGKKCAGILCTSRISGEAARAGCGIGINVIRPAQSHDLEGIDAAFLSDHAPAISRDQLLITLLKTYHAYWPLLQRPLELVAAWELRAHLAGETYRLRLDESAEEFTAAGLRLGPDGTLVVHHAGAERVVTLADATVI